MPACPQCGTEAPASAQFCPKCGLPLASPLLRGSDEAPAGAAAWHRGRRVVLVFLAVVVGLALLFIAAMVYFVRNTTIVTSTKNGGRVEAPSGVFTTNRDPAKLAHSLGVAVYPDAQGTEGAQAQLASASLVILLFHTTDTSAKVLNFYHVRYPDADVADDGQRVSLVQFNARDTLTIAASPLPNHQTEIAITDVRH
jgi:zinc-ribbon domain